MAPQPFVVIALDRRVTIRCGLVPGKTLIDLEPNYWRVLCGLM
jgi:hypothetical protein